VFKYRLMSVPAEAVIHRVLVLFIGNWCKVLVGGKLEMKMKSTRKWWS